MDEQMREKFEAWARSVGQTDGDLARNRGGYIWNAQSLAFKAFCAGAALSQPAAAQGVNSELLEALQTIVSLDDGDRPSLWKFQSEFDAARAAIAKATP